MPFEREAQWARVDRLLEQALDRPPSERETYIERATAGEPEVRREVLDLLRADATAEGFLERSALPVRIAGDGGPDLSGTRLGPYRLLRQLGRGGMSTVYLAEREEGFRRQVAIKVLQGVFPLRELRRRLHTERQILASLEHPHIARLYDGGNTRDGQPYLVMEYVRGEPLDEYCRRRDPSLEEKLRLFLQICDAVEYAHRNLLVHRDLKPANILVTAEGEPKLLDFGIAKLLDVDHFDGPTGAATRTGLRPMTPAFASPEQVRGGPVTTASDVYSLGVLLFHLLTGESPYRPGEDHPHALEAAVLEQVPPKPSDRTEGALARRLRGDLDTIVLKALRKEAPRRYGSARELAEDVERFLSHRPVLARPETLGYRAVKLVRRHTWGVLASFALLLLIVGFAAVAAVQSARLARERDDVQAERNRARQTSEFLLDLLSRPDPAQARGEELTVREVLDRGAERVDRLSDQPSLQAASLTTIGRVYRELGLFDEARSPLERSLELRRELRREAHPEIAESLRELALLDQEIGDAAAAETHFREALAMLQGLYGRRHPRVAEILNDLGLLLYEQERYDDAEPLLREALDQTRELLPEDDLRLAHVLNNLGLLLHDRGDLDGAERMYRESLELTREEVGETHPDTASSLNNLAVLLHDRGDLEGAQEFHRKSLELRRRLYGDRHPAVAVAAYNVARLDHSLGHANRAEKLYREALTITREVLGDEHRYVAIMSHHFGRLLRDQGKLEEAEARLLESLELKRRIAGATRPAVTEVLVELARLRESQQRLGDAEKLFRRALDIGLRNREADDPELARAKVLLAQLLIRRGERAEARRLAREALPVLHTEGERVDRPDLRELWSRILEQAETVLAESLPAES